MPLRGGSSRGARLPDAVVASVVAVSFLAIFPFAAHSAGDEAPALTNQEIVRMVASGMAADAVVERIAGSRCSFDLDPEMIAELKVAGVPETVLEAMMRKSPAAASPAAKSTTHPKGWIEIVFDDDPALEPWENSVDVPAAAVDPNSKTAHPVELAFVVTCDVPDHVPDFWDRLSPMGVLAGRHQVLFFHPGTSEPAARRKGRPRIHLLHPPTWRFEADAGAHRGWVVVAARAVGAAEYAPFVAAPYSGLAVEEGRMTTVKLQLRSGTKRSGSRSDPEHPVLPAPNLTNIGSTVRTETDMKAVITIVEISPPRNLPPAGGGAEHPPDPSHGP